MLSFLQQFGRWFVLAFALGFVMPRLDADFLKADILAPDRADVYSSGSLEDAIVSYHTQMNAYTNAYLKLLLNPDLTPDAVQFPGDDSACEGNVSTYCLALLLNQELTTFQSQISLRLDDFSDAKSTLQSKDTSSILLDDAISQAILQENELREQLLYAADTLDLTLAVYNQIQMVYPVHLELQQFVENLEQFRDRLAQVRDVIELYPSKFIGATTAQCK